jgi:hypothetical protein
MTVIPSVPTLAQIKNWPTDHLEAAASSWPVTAHTWEDSFTAVYRQAPAPGGTPWDGQAADAAIKHVGADRLKVLEAADTVHGAAAVARNGISEIRTAQELVLQTVSKAQSAGFVVGDDLSVTPAQTGGPAAVRAARAAQAQQFAALIRTRAALLAVTDERIGAQITTATQGLNASHFFENPLLPSIPLPEGPHLIHCIPTPGGSWLCDCYDVGGGGPYVIESPIDVSGVAD